MTRVSRLALLVASAVVVAALCGCATAVQGAGAPAVTRHPLPSPSSTTTCHAARMTASVGTGPEVVASSGGHGVSVRLRNNSGRTCVLRGFVTVVYLSEEGGPSFGRPTVEDRSGLFPSDVLHLARGDEAVVPLSNVFRASSCDEVAFWGYRVVLPGQDEPIDVPIGGTRTAAGGATSRSLGSTMCSTAHMVIAPVQDPTTM